MLTAYDDLIGAAAGNANLDPRLFTAQVVQESGGDPWAFRYERQFFLKYIQPNPKARTYQYGPLGACSYGLMQIMGETAYEMGWCGPFEQLFIPSVNLTLGAKKMAALWAWAGGTAKDYPKALAAYNEGTGNAIGGPPFMDEAYVSGVYRLAGLPRQLT